MKVVVGRQVQLAKPVYDIALELQEPIFRYEKSDNVMCVSRATQKSVVNSKKKNFPWSERI